MSFLRTRGGPAFDCDDLAQETFLKAYQNLSSFSPTGSFASWLLTIARNTLFDHIRKVQRERRLIRESAAEPFATEATEIVDSTLDLDAFVAALAPEDRTLIEMRVFQGLSFAEIGGLLDVKEGTLRVRFHRLMASLRDSVTTGDKG